MNIVWLPEEVLRRRVVARRVAWLLAGVAGLVYLSAFWLLR